MAQSRSTSSSMNTRSSQPVLLANQDLSTYNTFGIPARARWFTEVHSTEQLQQVLDRNDLRAIPKLMLGGGSNVLFAGDYNGLVMHNAIHGISEVQRDPNHILLRVGGGETWNDVVAYAVQRGWGGIENLSLIPGTAGAAPIQNIGAYGVELETVFEHLEAVELVTGRKKVFDRNECRFGYRDSIFKRELKGKWMITHLTLRLDLKPTVNLEYGSLKSKLEEMGLVHPTVQDVSEAVKAIRRSKLPDPSRTGNAGSFFKNPVVDEEQYRQLQAEYPNMPAYDLGGGTYKLAAGWLIEQTGWKGQALGRAATWHQQALVIINKGGATGHDVLALSQRICEDVKKEFGIILEPEVNIIE